MQDLQGQIALVTGASSGIGAACAILLAEAGARLIVAARRQERLQELALKLEQSSGHQPLLLTLDVRDPEAVAESLGHLPSEWQDIDILVNNAGLSRGLDKLHEGHLADWEEMIDTNVKGLLYVSRLVIPGMVARNRGHVVNIGSIAGHQTYPKGNVYCASKAAVRALSQGMKQDLLGTNIRVSEVDPGMVETEFSDVRFHGDQQRAAQVYQGMTPLTASDIAEIVLFCLTLPSHVNLSELLVVPVDQATVTQVHRHT
ncbi:MAG: SDR family oxidoreductase [Synechococcaceae cyanobacterium SM2_3_2]|nr:SDR family oxidoreductase [Synechococcaceae cyanobacterium SM2_3_2]